MKILVTGDREWTNLEAVIAVLQRFPAGTKLVHGACRGLDNMAAAVGEALGFIVIPYPADWKKYPKAASPIRNQEMLDKEHLTDDPIDICIGFHNNIELLARYRGHVGSRRKGEN